ncbi:MAG: squalene synthase HpnC [Actinomycetota bacterium]|nr:squalene synthase HpnC [Actinomycetota bacterium]
MTTRSLSCTQPGGTPPPGLPSPESVLGRVGGENFAVASRVLPAAARRHLLAFYGFARFTDQIGDTYGGDRLAALDWLEEETHRALSGPSGRAHPLVGPAVESVVRLGIDPQPLFDLIEANRRDQLLHTYADFETLVGYCRLSANPVGRLVLGAFGYCDHERLALSDAICTALQLIEHWQDVREDAEAGRIYLPAEDLERFGVGTVDLAGPPPASPALRSLMAFEVARARTWMDLGAPLVAMLGGRARWAVVGFVAGGRAALDDLARRDFDCLVRPGRPAGRSLARNLVLTARSRRGEAA